MKSKYHQYVSKIAKAEGKKHQASIGDVREIVGIVARMAVKDPSFHVELLRTGSKKKQGSISHGKVVRA